MGSKQVLASAAASATYNMGLQLMMRLLTFILNAFILRFISKDVLGIVNVRLMLLYTTTLFVSREAFRRACLSSDLNKPWRQVINFLWCTLPLGLICSIVFGLIWSYLLEQPNPDTVPHHSLAVLCFSVSAVIELLAEPLWICGQMLLFVRIKVFIEGLSLMLRCVVSVILILIFPDMGLLAFSIAQLCQSVAYTVMYYGYFVYHINTQTDPNFPFKQATDLFPKAVQGKSLISWSLASLTWSFFKQSFLKQILTEGERYVMTVFDVLSFADQGVYDVINNLGSLVARFLFLPLEDSGYLFFSQTLQRGVAAKAQPSESIVLASKVFHCLLKTVTLIGLTIVAFGYPYSYLALDLYGGQVLSSGSGPTLLRSYCLYVLLLAVNGITECFTFATMGKQEIDRYNHKMLIFSAVFLGSAWYLTGPLGSLGFILANCLNMAARICHSIYYSCKFYQDSDYQPMKNVLPARPVLLVFVVSFSLTVMSEILLCCSYGWMYRILHIVVGGICFSVLLGTIYVCEKSLIVFIRQQYLKRNEEMENTEHTSQQTKEKKDL